MPVQDYSYPYLSLDANRLNTLGVGTSAFEIWCWTGTHTGEWRSAQVGHIIQVTKHQKKFYVRLEGLLDEDLANIDEHFERRDDCVKPSYLRNMSSQWKQIVARIHHDKKGKEPAILSSDSDSEDSDIVFVPPPIERTPRPRGRSTTAVSPRPTPHALIPRPIFIINPALEEDAGPGSLPPSRRLSRSLSHSSHLSAASGASRTSRRSRKRSPSGSDGEEITSRKRSRSREPTPPGSDSSSSSEEESDTSSDASRSSSDERDASEDFTVQELSKLFDTVARSSGNGDRADVFERETRCTYDHNKWYRTKQRFADASQSLRNEFVNYGLSDKGLWPGFAKATLKEAKEKPKSKPKKGDKEKGKEKTRKAPKPERRK